MLKTNPSLEQPNSPIQVCPTDPPTPCARPNCLGSPDPPNAYRCKSRSTIIENSVEITLFACQCCPDYPHQLYCDDERCDGEEKGRCKSELLKGCHCRSRDQIPELYGLLFPSCVVPDSLVLDPLQERSTTPTEPPPISSLISTLFWNTFNKRYEDLSRHSVPRKDIGSEIFLRIGQEIYFRWNSLSKHGRTINKSPSNLSATGEDGKVIKRLDSRP
jgi:hypothetical protein